MRWPDSGVSITYCLSCWQVVVQQRLVNMLCSGEAAAMLLEMEVRGLWRHREFCQGSLTRYLIARTRAWFLETNQVVKSSAIASIALLDMILY